MVLMGGEPGGAAADARACMHRGFGKYRVCGVLRGPNKVCGL